MNRRLVKAGEFMMDEVITFILFAITGSILSILVIGIVVLIYFLLGLPV